ncbi:MAG: helix-turn-helix domain-containing protein [Opitutales bacterium]|nr:helix-turn-helix domain-containing protein [Opitutales bacterium]
MQRGSASDSNQPAPHGGATGTFEAEFPSLLPRGGPGPYTIREIARHLQVSNQNIMNLVEEGELVVLDVGTRRGRAWNRIPRESYCRWIAARLGHAPTRSEVINLSTDSLKGLLRDVAARLEIRGVDPVQAMKGKAC